MKIDKVDNYMPLYAYEKATNPDKVMIMRAFRQKDVEDVDRLVELSKGNRETVKTDEDWNVLANIIVFYIQRWPNEWMEFRNSMPDIRQTRKSGGYSGSKEIKYLAALPFRLERLIKVIFPHNQFNKSFSNKFIKKFKVFQVGGIQN